MKVLKVKEFDQDETLGVIKKEIMLFATESLFLVHPNITVIDNGSIYTL
jgi:hypothetical protein